MRHWGGVSSKKKKSKLNLSLHETKSEDVRH